MSTVLVTGSGSGLGKALVKALGLKHEVIPFDRSNGCDVLSPVIETNKLDILINCAGVNRINWLQDVADAEWDAVVNTNAKGIFKMAKACLPLLIASKGTILNIVSEASHRPMTCSLAYNASKAAAHIMTLQMARELTRRYNITVFGVAPNKLCGTGMSDYVDIQVAKVRGWSIEYSRDYQKTSWLCGEETPPHLVAEFIAYMLSSKERHKHLTGCVIPYGC